jgi:hypothetical protein
VYWVRRLLVLTVLGAVAGALVLGIGSLLDGRGGGREAAVPVGSTPRPSEPAPTTAATTGSPSASGSPAAGSPSPEVRRTLPPRPEGPCDPEDVIVTPEVEDAHVNRPIVIRLMLTTLESEACTFEVSPETVFLAVTSEDGAPVWASQDCPEAVPTEDVVPRRDEAAVVEVVWSGQESDSACTRATDWALAGVYTATAVARGSVTPIDVGFLLGHAVRPTITRTAEPTDGTEGTPGGE